MLEIARIPRGDKQINVKPSDNIFAELGRNTYDFKDAVSELIDNSVAARLLDVPLEVMITVSLDDDDRPVYLSIRDNASGIPENKLASAISPAAIITENSLNEHGLGMKQAVASLGSLHYLATKTRENESALVIDKFKFDDIPIGEAQVEWEQGTEIVIKNLRPIVLTHQPRITDSLVPYLGARYRRFLRPENRKMRLQYILKRVGTDELIRSWDIEEIKPTYFHPFKRTAQPVIEKYELKRDGWSAKLTFGYSCSSSDEWEELGLTEPSKFHPYSVSMAHQGLDIVRFDRVILFHQFSELGIVPSRHNDWNTVRGELELIDGFRTATTKNAILNDRNFLECCRMVKDILSGEEVGPQGKRVDFLRGRKYPERLPEKLLRSRLAEYLRSNPMKRAKDVYEEYVVQGIEGYIDVWADNEAWELKVEQAKALDVYQLLMYVQVGGCTKGYLVANDFSTGAIVASDYINGKFPKLIELWKAGDLGLDRPPSKQEIEEYY